MALENCADASSPLLPSSSWNAALVLATVLVMAPSSGVPLLVNETNLLRYVVVCVAVGIQGCVGGSVRVCLSLYLALSRQRSS